jgi:hypothetical protein
VDIPPRTATDRYLSQLGERLDIVFDVDLGELIEGHHVVARGISLAPPEAELHYEFVPGLTEARRHELGGFGWYWMLSATDDVGTGYGDNNDGAFDGESGGAATHGTRDIGGQVPPHARWLTIRFQPVEDWTPPEPWRRQIVVDLQLKRLAG